MFENIHNDVIVVKQFDFNWNEQVPSFKNLSNSMML